MIVPKFQKFAELRHQDKYYVRGTFTHYNTDFAADVLHLADLGFKQISVEPVVAPPTEDYAIREEDLPVIFEQYDILAREMIKREKEGRGFNFFHFMIDLTGGPCVYKRLSGCGSGLSGCPFSPSCLSVFDWSGLLTSGIGVFDPSFPSGWDLWESP